MNYKIDNLTLTKSILNHSPTLITVWEKIFFEELYKLDNIKDVKQCINESWNICHDTKFGRNSIIKVINEKFPQYKEVLDIIIMFG
jgi:hypothetical protein